MIYLDNAATTRIDPEVLEAMLPYLTDRYGNAGSIHSMGRKAAAAIETARAQVANSIGANPDQIIFTSGGSEANSLAIHGIKPYLVKNKKNIIISSPTEHESVLSALNELEKPLCCNDFLCIKDTFHTQYVSIKRDGTIDVDNLNHIMSKDVGLVSIMYVNNETGAVNPIDEIGRICNSNNVLFHTDCVQAFGGQEINVNKIGCDFLSVSGHKIHAPKGIGALYVRDKSILSPIIYGGANQEYGKRAGTENVAEIVGFGVACQKISNTLEETLGLMAGYKKLFIDTLSKALGDMGFVINGQPLEEPGKTLSITFNNVDAETLVLLSDAMGVCISAGSACESYNSNPSHVLVAMGLSPDEARDSIRVSFSRENTEEEVKAAAIIIGECASRLSAR